MAKVLIICMSTHHKNTERIAERIAKVLGAAMQSPAEVLPETLKDYDLIGFGSGIYFGKFHSGLEKFVDSLPPMRKKKAFIFSTSGASKSSLINRSRMPLLRQKLEGKGFVIVDEFNCLAYDTWGCLGWFGGINKGRPDDGDLREAEEFAKKLKTMLY